MGTEKIIIFLFFVLVFWSPRYSQAQKISIRTRNASLEEILKKIKNKSGYDMVYSKESIHKLRQRQSVDFKETELADILRHCLREYPLDFRIYHSTIILFPKTRPATASLRTISGKIYDEENKALPQATIRIAGSNWGTVSDAEGRFKLSLPGKAEMVLVISYVGKQTVFLTIREKNDYEVVLPTAVSEMENVIVNGYQSIARNEMTGATSTLSGDALHTPGVPSLEAALQGAMNGLGVTIPSGLTGATGRMRIRGASTIIGNPSPLIVVDGIIRENIYPFDQTLVNDLLNNGESFAGARNSISGNTLSGINIGDIEKITLLKDVSATAIYGIRASNGVIVITTRRGQGHRQQVRFRSDFTFTALPTYRNAQVMNSLQRVGLSRELIRAGISLPAMPDDIGYESIYLQMMNKEIPYEEFNRQVSELERKNTDWLKLLGRHAFGQNYHLNISSGKDGLAWYASLGYRKENNAYRGNDRQTYTGMLNLSVRISPRWQLTAWLSGNQIHTNGYFPGINPEQYALTTNRTLDPQEFYAKGDAMTLQYKEKGYTHFIRNKVHFNFLNELQHTGNSNKTSEINLHAQLKYRLLPGLSLTFTPAWAYGTEKSEIWADERSHYISCVRGGDYGVLNANGNLPFLPYLSPLPYGGVLHYSHLTRQAFTLKGQIDFRKTVGADARHTIGVTLGAETRQNKYTGQSGTEWGYLPEKGKSFPEIPDSQTERFRLMAALYPGYAPLAAYGDYTLTHETELTDHVENVLSFYGTAGYTYDSRYTACINVRNDASNRFGKHTNHRFYPVWSAGLRWDLHNESWFPASGLLNELTFRLSYGRQGNVVTNVSPNTLVEQVAQDPVTNENYLKLQQPGNPDLKWEKTTSVNMGTEISLWHQRLNVVFDVYRKETRDIVTEKQIPTENGLQKSYINSGAISNEGFEWQVNLTAVQHRHWGWEIGFTANYTKEVLKKSFSDAPTLNYFTDGRAVIDGFPVHGFWSVPFTGLSAVNGAPQFAIIDQPGGKQKVNDGLLDYLVYSGVSEPILIGGIYTTLRYKGVSFNVMFNYQAGHYKRLNPFMTSGKGGMLSIPSGEVNASTQLLHRWQQPGDELHTDIPALCEQDEDLSAYLPDNSLSLKGHGPVYRYALYNRSTARVVQASHLRCNRISLNYRTALPGITAFSLGLTVTNPFVIKHHRLKGQDPEVIPMDADVYTPTMNRQRNYTISAEFIF